MKRILTVVSLYLLGLLACSSKPEGTRLQPDSETYQLAQSLSSKVPYLDPDENRVLVSTKYFDLAVGDVLQALRDNVGNRIQQLQMLDAEQVKRAVESSAEDLAEKKLLLLKAEQAKFTATEAEVDSALRAQYARAGGEARYMQLLNSAGVSLEHVRKEVRDGLIVQKYLEDVLEEELAVSEADIEAAYQEDKTASVQHILLSTQGKSDSEKVEIRKEMEGILARARQGEDFGELAKQYSDDPGSKEKGGLYEDFGRGRMVKPFEDAAFNVPVGEISDIVETRFGYHILKVIERKKETRPLEEIHDELQAQIRRRKYRDAYEAYIARLKEEAQYQLLAVSE